VSDRSALASRGVRVRARESVTVRLRQKLFAISPSEASFDVRGFASAPPARRERLEQIGRVFVAGYNAAISVADPVAVLDALKATAEESRGFAFEGAAMAFALLDVLSPFPSRRFARFLEGAAKPHVYMAHVGAGWALARVSPRLAWRLGPLDPLLRWLMFDGFGFHVGYFDARASIDRQRRPTALKGYASRAFDQGLGRAIWFAKGANVEAAAAAPLSFEETRRADLWSGIGLAAAYAGGISAHELDALVSLSGPYRVHLGQGAAFAAKARERARYPATHTEAACQAFCGMSAMEAAAITDAALPIVAPSDQGAAYEDWRREIRRRLGAERTP
jgi:hypothetical protein